MISSSAPQIILASNSPRRRQLLAQLGLEFIVQAADIEEQLLADESASEYVMRLAAEKAHAVYQVNTTATPRIIVSADTCILCDARILGKPRNRQDAHASLSLLSGRSHQVLTGVCVLSSAPTAIEAQVHCRLSQSSVEFRSLSREEIEAYWQTGEPCDKAGSYAIQGLGAMFIRAIQGSYSGIMGLPLFETAELLRGAGVEVLETVATV